MPPPLRIEYPEAADHVTAWGNARAAIFLDDDDRRRFLALFAEVIERRTGRFGCVAMDEPDVMAAIPHVALNPVRARLVKRAGATG